MSVACLRNVALIASLSLGLAACAYDDGYGYGGMSMGWGSGYGGYYDPYYDDYGYGYPSYYGWYGGFYYPGSGYWVYDRGGHRHRWSDKQRRYWEGRRGNGDGHRESWGGYGRGDHTGTWNGNEGAQAGVIQRGGEVQQPHPPRQGYRGNRPSMRDSGPATRPDRGFYRAEPGDRGQENRSRRH